MNSGLQGAGQGAIYGGVAGFAYASYTAHSQRISPWTGKAYPKDTPTLQQNRANGLVGKDVTAAEIEAAGGQVVSRQVHIRLGGKYVKIDLAAKLPGYEQIVLIEVKTGPTADLKGNQTFVIPKAFEGSK